MNMRGPFGDFMPGKFGAVTTDTKDRPRVTYRGARVTRHDAHDLTQVDEYPQATGWYIDDDGQLDVRNEDCTVSVIASYPSGQWRRAWFPDAEQNIAFEVPEVEEEEETNDDVPDQYK